VPALVRGDPGRLRQVLTNLVGNAVKFTDTGSVQVGLDLAGPDDKAGRTGRTEQAGQAGRVRLLLTVRDTGIGIPEDKQETVFQSFSQVGTSAHAKYGGTGLGLAISRELVELMGGRIWVESAPGKGSAFFFTVELGLPAGTEDEAGAGTARQAAASGAKPLRILLAEDNAINRILAVELLGKRGHLVTPVENGREAVEALARERYDVVLMDVRMPEMDGEEAARIIKRSPPPGVDPTVPVVALTAHALAGDRERFLAESFDDYIAKPLDMAELDRVLARVLARRGRGKGGKGAPQDRSAS
jgi:two-component system CheB/CheR fusion protein